MHRMGGLLVEHAQLAHLGLAGGIAQIPSQAGARLRAEHTHQTGARGRRAGRVGVGRLVTPLRRDTGFAQRQAHAWPVHVRRNEAGTHLRRRKFENLHQLLREKPSGQMAVTPNGDPVRLAWPGAAQHARVDTRISLGRSRRSRLFQGRLHFVIVRDLARVLIRRRSRRCAAGHAGALQIRHGRMRKNAQAHERGGLHSRRQQGLGGWGGAQGDDPCPDGQGQAVPSSL